MSASTNNSTNFRTISPEAQFSTPEIVASLSPRNSLTDWLSLPALNCAFCTFVEQSDMLSFMPSSGILPVSSFSPKRIRSSLWLVFLMFFLLDMQIISFIGLPASASLKTSQLSAYDYVPRRSDVNGDGIVNILDIVTVLRAWISYPGHPKWDTRVDLNDDGRVNILDVALVSIDFGRGQEGIKIRTLLVAYGARSPLSQNRISHMAKFDIIDTDFEIGTDISKIKGINPNVLILGYCDVMARTPSSEDWLEVNQHEEWFLHDFDGKRLQNKIWGWYCMDVGNQGWREHYASYVEEKITLYGFDGVFADDVWSAFSRYAWTVSYERVPSYGMWHQEMLEFLRHVKSRIGSKILIVNTPDNGDYVDATDGKLEEDFAFKSVPGQTAIDNIKALLQISSKGKYYLASPYNIANDTKENMLFALSCFLLGVNGPNAYFGWKSIWDAPSHGYYAEFEEAESLGRPLGEYYSYQSVLVRDFTNGKVVVNVCPHSHTVDLQGTYQTFDGRTITNITLTAHSGLLLLDAGE